MNQNIFRSIYKKFYPKKFVIENKLSISDWRSKSIHYPESPKVNTKKLHGSSTDVKNFYIS